MNEPHDTNETATADNGGELDPRAAAALIEQIKRQALTTVAITHDGRAALDRYTAVLRQLLDRSGAPAYSGTRAGEARQVRAYPSAGP